MLLSAGIWTTGWWLPTFKQIQANEGSYFRERAHALTICISLHRFRIDLAHLELRLAAPQVALWDIPSRRFTIKSEV